MTTVQYQPIPKHPGYRAGDDGTIWSCWTAGGRHKQSVMSDTWKQMKPSQKPCGHLHANLKGKLRLVHALVLEAFVGPAPDGMECRHFPDRDPTNNRLENLSWGTRLENVHDKVSQGTQPRGSKVYNAKLDADAVRRIRINAEKLLQREWGKIYGVDQSIISEIISRKRWAHVD